MADIIDSISAHDEIDYRLLVESQSDMVVQIDAAGRFLYVNPSCCRTFGKTAKELLGSSFMALVHADDHAATARSLEALKQPPHFACTELRALTPAGWRWFYWQDAAVLDNNGCLSAIIGFGRDITEEKKNRTALGYANECFSQALTGSGHILYRLNMKKGSYDYLSPSFETITGYPASRFAVNALGKLRELAHPDDHAVIESIDEVVRNRTGRSVTFDYEFRLRKADGSYCWLHDYTTACFDEHDELECFFGSAYDITEHKQAEQALLESEERYRRFIATAWEGIGITDRAYTITYVNDRLAGMLGYEPAEMVGMPVSRLLPPEEQDRFSAETAARLQGESSQCECWHRRKDGSLIWLLTSSSPIMDDTGEFQGCFAMFTDLSDRRKAEIALQKSRDELEQRVAERTLALDRASKQVKRMTFELVKTEERERNRIAGELHDQVGQSLLLAKMKLDMLASELGMGSGSTRTGEISSLLESSLRDIRSLIFAMRPPMLDTAGLKAALERLCVSLRNDYHLQVAFICRCRLLPFAAEERYSLYQAVRELLLNVIKHAGTDRAELSITEKGDSIVICVSDRGSGFTPGSLADKQNAASGFGLFNVQQRIEHMGGVCSIASPPGQGTIVTLIVPLPSGNPGDRHHGRENSAC